MDHEVVGSVSKPSAPKIYDVWRRRGGKERKVNKNLGEITVPGGGKLRLISCTRLSPSCLHLRSRSLTRSNLFPSLSLSVVLYSTRRHEKEESLLLLRAVTTTYRPRKRRFPTDVFHFPPEARAHDLLFLFSFYTSSASRL